MSDVDSSDDEMDWEEIVPVQPHPQPAIQQTLPSTSAPLQITIRAPPKLQSESDARKQKSAEDARARFIRLQAHRIHTIALLANGAIRNNWINDDLLHVRFLLYSFRSIINRVC